MNHPGGLAPDYPTARTRFLAAATAAGASIEHHPIPEVGPDGEELAVDVAWIGPSDPDRLVLVVSGTHGVEGYAGSMCQSRWLEANPSPALPDGLALVVLHAHNPYGFAWVRRVNEDNVDLNRNFVDFEHPPENPRYDDLADLLAPADWSAESQHRTSSDLIDWAVEHGMEAMQEAVSGGQYHHPDGLFYGGTGPVRSHQILEELVTTRLQGAGRVAILDLHTGLGERGEVEIISSEVLGSPAYDRAVEWWGERVASNVEGGSVSATLTGEWMSTARGWLQPAEVSAVALEWGTIDSISVAQALRADNWLHCHGDPTGPDAPAIKAELRRAFAPVDDPEWDELIYTCFEGVLTRTLEVLG